MLRNYKRIPWKLSHAKISFVKDIRGRIIVIHAAVYHLLLFFAVGLRQKIRRQRRIKLKLYNGK